VGLPSASALTLNGGFYAAPSGTIIRTPGTGAGQLAITGGTSGFSAVSTNTTISLGGLATPATLTWGSASFNPSTFAFDATPTAVPTLANTLDLNGATAAGLRLVSVVSNSAAISGRITNSTANWAIFRKDGAGSLTLSNFSTFGLTNINYYNFGAGSLRLFMPSTASNVVGMVRQVNAAGGFLEVLSAAGTTNYYYGALESTQGPALKNADGGTMRVEGGTWVLPYLGQNNSSAQMRGTNYFTNTTLIIVTNDLVRVPAGVTASGLRYTVGSYYLQNGASWLMRWGDRFGFGEEQLLTRTNLFLDIGPGALLDVCASSLGFRLGGVNGTGGNTTTFVNQTGGLARIGVTPGTHTGSSGRSITVGFGNAAGATAYYNLAGGQLTVAETIQSGGAVSSNAFFLNGGTLTCRSFNTANFANMPDGTLINNGGTFAPGETNAAGYMIINGSGIMSPAASLAVDIGGTTATPAGVFQTNAPGFYDYFQVTNSLVIDGSLQVSLINGFVPAPTDSFEIIHLNLTGTNTVAGTFTNLVTGGLGLGRVAVLNQPGASFRVDTNLASKSILLTDYSAGGVPAPVAAFSGTPISGVRPLTVVFTNASTGAFTNGVWDFGNGTASTAGLTVTNVYTVAGTYTVSLIAEGPGGTDTNTQPAYITVSVPNSPTITSVRSVAGNLILQGNGGPTGGGYNYWLLSSTNVATPRTNWTILATNTFNVDGSFSNATPATLGERQRFFQLQMP
jgi:hypothetical protein